MKTKIDIRNLKKVFIQKDEALEVLKDIDISVCKNQFVTIIGPSGCGKSTILRILAGLEKDFMGDIFVEGLELKKYRKKFCYMPQKDLLMPWRTVYKNIVLPLEIDGHMDKMQELPQLIEDFGLGGFEDYYPRQISGGMKQRVGLLRTFLMGGDIMLLDEPFGALDAITRIKMQKWLLKVLARYKKTVLFVTHSIEEAITLSDRVYILSDRPAAVVREIDIELPQPRTGGIIPTDKFTKYRESILEALI
ncbi:MAG: ABC transporter ATP-binding protein [Clostridium sp.]|nr:ABC transporter ATP-binding protein [Clostridium sp.]